jgi:hypothetical protein
MRRLATLLSIVLFFFGCADIQYKLVDKLVHRDGNLPRYEFASGTRVGIINMVEERLTHDSFKVFSKKKTFMKKYDVDWKIPEIMEEYLRFLLQEDGRYEVVSLPALSSLQNYEITNLYAEQSLGKFRHEIDRLAEENNLQVVVIAGNHLYMHPDNRFAERGYGLRTSQGYSDTLAKVFGKAYAFTALGVQVYHSRPLTYIGGGRPSLAHLVSFPYPDDPHNIPKSDFDTIKPIIVADVKEIVMKALQKANLVEEKSSKQ